MQQNKYHSTLSTQLEVYVHVGLRQPLAAVTGIPLLMRLAGKNPNT